ncbi:MAG: redoxin domain-containing protein [Acidobacteriota bacterium]|nr:redoxin domain-containing protein [Acidobacteriota bacterium]
MMRQITGFLIILAAFVVFSGVSFGQMGDYEKQPKVRAPELTGGKGWLNTDKPLSIAGLKGKIVLLDFWTYGCINCIHIIPDLKKLEAKYQKELVVIGVHSAKFDNEKDTDNIRQIVLRYNIEHPIVNDADFKIWEAYAIKAWPGLVVIDPNGYVIETLFGEGHFEEIDKTIGETAAEFRKKGELNEQPLKFALERAKVGDLPLAFPGKVLADEKSKRLFIADSNHNRIVITDFNGKLIETIGSGNAAKTDGDLAGASFNRPQGLALDGDFLYVADTENHLIRRVDLKNKRVETVGGTGVLQDFDGSGGEALKTAINSPWDLTLVGKMLYIAMAGSHQIWRLDTEKNTLEPYAGTRAEARYDGKIGEAAFAQPSGIVSDGKHLFVADSESNVIRQIDFQTEEVETLVGGDLFQFGDKDGEGDDVLLQHPLGIALYDGKLLIADTYNHKIKLLDADKQTVETFLGTGKSGQTDGANPTFYEPGGLSIADGKLFIADTNNQAIRVVDLKTKQVSTLKIEGLTPPLRKNETESSSAPNSKEITVESKTIAANSANSLVFNIKLPNGFHLNQNAPQKYEISSGDVKSVKIGVASQKFKTLPVEIPFQTAQKGAANLKAKLTVYFCREDNTGVCMIKTLVWNVPLNIVTDKNAAKKIEISASVE